MNFELTGRMALVTGGTGGLGSAISVALARLGCRVVATGLTDGEVAQFAAGESTVEAWQLDVTDEQQIERVLERVDRLDILINAAGIILRDRREFDLVGFQRVLDVNLTGTMRMATACHSRLADSRGCVVNVASMLTFFGSGYVPAYSASKGGVAQLTKSLAIAWAPNGIRVNAVAPGWIETELTSQLYQHSERSAQIVQRTPLQRWGRPQDVTGAVAFLCSPAADFITGVILPVDGGYSIA